MTESTRIGRNEPCPCGSGKKFKRCCQNLAGIHVEADSISNLIELGKRHHQAAALNDAIKCYEKALAKVPDHPEALHYLGILHAQSGNIALAIELIRKSTRLDPANPIFANNLATTLHRAGNFDEAADNFRKAIEANPNEPDYYNNLALVLNDAGKFDAAIASCERAIAMAPGNPFYYNNLGLALNAQGRAEEAIAAFKKALSIHPASAGTLNNLGIALKQQGRLDDTIEVYRTAISLAPGMPQLHSNLSSALLERGKIRESIESGERAVSIDPNYPEAHYNWGNALKADGRLDEAVQCYGRALVLKPDYPEALNNLGIAQCEQGRLTEAIANFNHALSIKSDYLSHNNLGNAFRDEGRLDEAVASYRKALSIKPDYAEGHSNLLFTMQFDPAGSPPERALEEAQRFAAQFEEPLKAFWQPHRNLRDPERRLKVAYMSPDFRRHPVAYFVEPVLAKHDKHQVEIFCYYNHVQHDEITDRLARYADHWFDCRNLTDTQLAEHIRASEIDILVDLAGHTAHNRLLTLARKPAPVQITYVGYPGTTGLAAMDYRLTDRYADPVGSESSYTEKLLRLPDSLWCYRPGASMPAITPLPALKNGYITFGSFNHYNKIDRHCVELWSKVLMAVPDSRLMIATVPAGESKQRLVEQFAAHGITLERLDLHGKLPRDEFHRILQQADIALDPVTVNGATTTCETLWLGVPTLSLVGNRFLERAGLSLLNAAGLPGLAAASPQEFINIAAGLSRNPPKLAQLRESLRARMAASPLVDEFKFTRALEKIYRDVWITWCMESA